MHTRSHEPRGRRKSEPLLIALGDADSEPMLLAVVSAACASLGFYDVDQLSFPDRARLASREPGMATGLRALELIVRQNDGNGQKRSIDRERLLTKVENFPS